MRYLASTSNNLPVAPVLTVLLRLCSEAIAIFLNISHLEISKVEQTILRIHKV